MDDIKKEVKLFDGDVVIKPMFPLKIHVPRTSNGEVPAVPVTVSKDIVWFFGIIQFGAILDNK